MAQVSWLVVFGVLALVAVLGTLSAYQRRRVCGHAWRVLERTWTPPRNDGSPFARTGSPEDTGHVLLYLERSKTGVTTVLLSCPECGETRTEEMLGERCEEAVH